MDYLVQSIPNKSKFNIIGFGSSFEKHFKSSVEYNDSNTKVLIQSLAANMGGTNIQSLLTRI